MSISSSVPKDYQAILSLTKKKSVALVVYWASWCTYCHELFANLNHYNELHPKHPIFIVGISLDETLKDAKKEASTLLPHDKQSFFCGTMKENFKTRKLPYIELYHNGIVDTVYEGVSKDKISYMKKRCEWLSTGEFDQDEDNEN